MSGRPVDVSRAIARKRIQSRVGRGAEGIKALWLPRSPASRGLRLLYKSPNECRIKSD